jgi:hypothetical protein
MIIWREFNEGRMTDDVDLPLQATVRIDPGVCRFPTTLQARTDGTMVEFEVLHSDCPHVRNLNKHLRRMTIWSVMHMPYSENAVYLLCGEFLKHSSCPVPLAMIKCAEASAELALKKSVLIEFVG